MLGLPIDSETETDRTRSDLERDFLWLCRRHGIPAPEVNVRVRRWSVDFLWPERRLVVETDSYRYHRGERPSRMTVSSTLGLRALGYDVLRLTGRQIAADAAPLVSLLRAELSAFRD